MSHPRRFLALASLAGAFCFASGCVSRIFNVNDKRQEQAATKDIVDDGSKGPDWIYNGMLPKLSNARIVVSLPAHTARVTGFAPAGFDVSVLPDYAHVDTIGGKKRIMVVYPISTVDPKFAQNGPGPYFSVTIFPWNPKGVGSHPDTPWGGFPYIEYNSTRNLAFHGPITSDGSFWRLQRGPVSHACNRMQGEHVTELAHLLGVDMTVPHKVDYSESRTVAESPADPLVNILSTHDKIPDGSLAGNKVDVDYPVHRNESVADELQVNRPKDSVQMFKTWDARSHPNWVCAWRKDRASLGMKQCADLGSGSGSASGSTGAADVNICPGVGEINVRNDALDKLSTAQAGEPVKRLGKTKTDAAGVLFEQVFFKNPPTGTGWIAQKFLPPCR